MKREKLKLAQISERHDCWVAVYRDGLVCGFAMEPDREPDGWFNATDDGHPPMQFPCYEPTDAPADWRDSLTPPPMRPVTCDKGHEPEVVQQHDGVMSYKRADMSTQPEWLRDGPVWCNVSYLSIESQKIIVWWDEELYWDTRGEGWRVAEPIEVWEPKPDEPVFAWYDRWRDDYIVNCTSFSRARHIGYDHIARAYPGPMPEKLTVGHIKSLGLEELK